MVNRTLVVDQYSLPNLSELFATLAGGKTFIGLIITGLSALLLDQESTRYVTVNTHKGLYRYNRLPFGIASAPAIF